jgi:hypothetical protein
MMFFVEPQSHEDYTFILQDFLIPEFLYQSMHEAHSTFDERWKVFNVPTIFHDSVHCRILLPEYSSQTAPKQVKINGKMYHEYNSPNDLVNNYIDLRTLLKDLGILQKLWKEPILLKFLINKNNQS